MEGYGTGADIRGYEVQPVHEGGGRAGGGGGTVQIPGRTPGLNSGQLSSDLPEHQEGTKSMGTTGQDSQIEGPDT